MFRLVSAVSADSDVSDGGVALPHLVSYGEVQVATTPCIAPSRHQVSGDQKACRGRAALGVVRGALSHASAWGLLFLQVFVSQPPASLPAGNPRCAKQFSSLEIIIF